MPPDSEGTEMRYTMKPTYWRNEQVYFRPDGSKLANFTDDRDAAQLILDELNSLSALKAEVERLMAAAKEALWWTINPAMGERDRSDGARAVLEIALKEPDRD